MKAFFYAAFVLPFLSILALAQEATVTIPASWGADIANFIGPILAAVLLWMIRKLPSQIVSVLMTMRVDQLLNRAVDFGMATVVNATKDKPLTMNIGNAVVAKALQYALDNGPSAVIKWAGGRELLRQKIIARLNVEDTAALH